MAQGAEHAIYPTLPAPQQAQGDDAAPVRVICRRIAPLPCSAAAVGTYRRARAYNAHNVPSILIDVMA